jgi:hypothetical protein
MNGRNFICSFNCGRVQPWQQRQRLGEQRCQKAWRTGGLERDHNIRNILALDVKYGCLGEVA